MITPAFLYCSPGTKICSRACRANFAISILELLGKGSLITVLLEYCFKSWRCEFVRINTQRALHEECCLRNLEIPLTSIGPHQTKLKLYKTLFKEGTIDDAFEMLNHKFSFFHK